MSRLDVLSVMQDGVADYTESGHDGLAEDMSAARAAVAELIEAASEIRTSLSLTRSNVLTEIKRGATQWDGVPELLQARIKAFDGALARVTGGAA